MRPKEPEADPQERSLFVGLWPPMFWLMGDAARRLEEKHDRRRWFGA